MRIGLGLKRRLRFHEVLLITACLAVGAWVAFTVGQRTEPRSLFTVSPLPQNFGEVWESEAFAWSFDVTNVSTRDWRITDLETSCGCASISVADAEKAIPAGASRRVNMILNLRHGHDSQAGLATRPFSVSIRPLVEGARPQPPWHIRGRVRPLFVASPSTVNYINGDEIVQGIPSERTEVNVTTHPGVTLRATADAEVALVDVLKGATDHEYRVLVQPCHDQPVGEFSTEIQLEGWDKGGALIGAAPLGLFGRVVGHIAVTPHCVELGMRRIGEVATCDVVLQSRTAAPFLIRDVELYDVALAAPLDTTTRHHRCVMHFIQRVQHEGDASSRIRLEIETDGGPETMEIPVRYRGIARAGGS